MPFQSGFGVGRHSRINTGLAADSSVQLVIGACYLNGIEAFNLSSATLLFLKLYDSSGGTASTTLTPVWRAPIPFAGSLSTGSLTNVPAGAGLTWDASRQMPFNNGFMYAVCSALADNANTTAAANLAIVNIQVEGQSSNYVANNCS